MTTAAVADASSDQADGIHVEYSQYYMANDPLGVYVTVTVAVAEDRIGYGTVTNAGLQIPKGSQVTIDGDTIIFAISVMSYDFSFDSQAVPTTIRLSTHTPLQAGTLPIR